MSAPVRTALVSTAGHCEVACSFCFRADRARGFLTTATYTRALSRLKETGVEGVCLTGGEPTHHPELRQLVRLALQFGMTVSMVTSARSEAEVSTLAEVGHLLTNVTVSADSQGAMALGRTTRTAASAVATLDAVDTPSKVLHLTYWDVGGEEATQLAGLLAGKGIDVQLSPVLLSEDALRRDGRSVQDSLMQRARDTASLGRHFRLSNGYRSYLDDLRRMQLSEEESHPCRSATPYVSAKGEVRHCPYGASEISVHAPRTEIRAFLDAPATDRVVPDCAAICRPASRDCAAA
ncbi:radical SAM protein [Streptomyces sp. H27-H1]|uniref:radical SAM protein n=1 Tax=unclassified Streptomyces TaxID=2593676 RepID=UPI00226F8BD2|nr:MULTISPECIES: radical SAM protein [unclassified Streptomyces]MCY0926966.1 radical SAM protein [Streptomyces sp. H27-H1]MCY0933230.1 radical SAM protein [Streptomyces sp. H34-S4]